MHTSNSEFLEKCKTMKLEQLETLLKSGKLTEEQEIICKNEINSILGHKKYDIDKEGTPETSPVLESTPTNHTALEVSNDYKVSKGVSKFVSFGGWFICAISLILVLVSLTTIGRLGLLAIAPALGLFVGGLILVMAGQVTRAALDNANYSKQMLEIMRKKM